MHNNEFYSGSTMSKEPLVHSLYVGSRGGSPFADEDRCAVIEAASSEFDCFTVMDADGYFQGRRVATLVIKITTEKDILVEELGHRLGDILGQEAVGLETDGRYKSITMG